MTKTRSRFAAWLTLTVCLTAALPAIGDEEADPWEGFNRKVHVFNEVADGWIIQPVARGYRKVTPDPVEQGVDNVFSNLWEVNNIFNGALQWRWGQVANDSGRR